MRVNAITRIRIITAGVLALALLLLIRLYFIQVAHSEDYQEAAEQQYVHTVQDLFNRGNIYFSTKNGEYVSAATIKTGFLLAINPKAIKNAEETYEKLASIIEFDREAFLLRAAKEESTYQEIEQRVSREDAARIEELGLDGVLLYRNQWRYYPGEDLSAHAVGFVGYDGDELTGLYGLERHYNYVLARDDERLSVNFFAEIFSNLGNLVFDTKDGQEGHVVTSIDPTVAKALEGELKKTQEKWDSTLTGGIIMNPKTGSVYALSAYPSFVLNDRAGVEISQFRNPIIEDVYEMGSIMKPLTMAAGIDSGAITPASTYYDAGSITLSDYTISNFDGRGRGYVPMQEVLNQSLNTGAAYIVNTMGKERFRKYFLGLDLGTETGIDLPNEAYGLVENLNSPRELEYATASFGQGIAITPIEATRALSTLANGGRLVTPHIAKEIQYEDGRLHPVDFPPDEQVFSEETAETVTRMLVEVVDDALAGGKRSMEHYTIAAKTGTAQIAQVDGRGYYDDRFLHSFFGYFPAYDPEFFIFLYTVEPKEVRYASETLTDPFMELTTFLINYYNIAPDR